MVNANPIPGVEQHARVLVVDDEPGVVNFIARALRGRGFAADTAGGGDEALALLGAGAYDIVLLDLRMPATNGVIVLKEVMATRPEQRVVVVSAAADTRIKVRCLELGAADFIAKPFDLAELIARVRAHVRRTAVAPPAKREIRRGRLVFDIDRRTVDAGMGPVALTSREYRLLHHLADRAGEPPCSREELLDAVWDTPF